MSEHMNGRSPSYFVAFTYAIVTRHYISEEVFQEFREQQFSTVEIEIAYPITNFEDLKKLHDYICTQWELDHKTQNVVILSWRRFDEQLHPAG